VSDKDGERSCFLTVKYPNIQISFFFKTEIDGWAKQKSIKGTKLFRRIIQILIPDDKVWATSNRKKMILNYKETLFATLGLFLNFRI
jgi:hypothetical protein